MGGPQALAAVLPAIPRQAPPIILAQHMPGHFTRAFAARLDQECAIDVREAADGERPAPGTCLIAPGDQHIVVRRDASGTFIELIQGPPLFGHRPSVDVLFKSVAAACGSDGVGVLLTGMGHDGAAGLKAMRDAGAATIVQDEATSAVWGMPRAAVEGDAAEEIVALERIPNRILERSAHSHRSS